jgi:hypothetical protein
MIEKLPVSTEVYGDEMKLEGASSSVSFTSLRSGHSLKLRSR